MPSEQECIDFNIRFEQQETQLNLVQKDFHNHIREVRADLADHISEQASRHNELIDAQRQNTEAITALSHSTQGLVEAWQAAQGTVKFASVVGGFLKWGAGIALAVGSLYAYFKGV